jgi:hypothetical protein
MNKKLLILAIYITALHCISAAFFYYKIKSFQADYYSKMDDDVWSVKQELSNQIAESLGCW